MEYSDIKTILVGLIFGIFCLIIVSSISGCTTTKIVQVPVPVPCVKPKNLPLPHDYMRDLSEEASAGNFVKACLATRESYANAYESCKYSIG